jgi:transcriptional regulator with XRE-family HTH domain
MHIDTQTAVRLRALRTASGDRMADVAEDVGISESLLSRIESGQRRVTPDVLQRLAAHYDVAAESLGSDTGTQDPTSATPGAHWPEDHNHMACSDEVDTIALAEVAISTTMKSILRSRPGDDHVARYRMCKALAELASRPLEALTTIGHTDDDPLIRLAACQMLTTLTSAYCAEDV